MSYVVVGVSSLAIRRRRIEQTAVKAKTSAPVVESCVIADSSEWETVRVTVSRRDGNCLLRALDGALYIAPPLACRTAQRRGNKTRQLLLLAERALLARQSVSR